MFVVRIEALVENLKIDMKENQVISKRRVSDHGEVFTAKREVNAMLDLVKNETVRIESRFLEPACGTGNFLTEVLNRKLHVVEARYAKSQLEYERYSVTAISSIYGIDILEDNVVECRSRLFEIFNDRYDRLYKETFKVECKKAIKYILGRNIIWGDALTLNKVDDNTKPIVFSEWSPVNGSMIKRRDFTFHGLLTHARLSKEPLFSDLGDDIFIPTPVNEFPVTHFLRIADVEP
jgi:hypothetical protein